MLPPLGSAGCSAPRRTPTCVSLGPLSEDEVWQLVREMGHVSTPNGGRRFAGRLFRITAGNPFYVIELLKTMFAQGLLAMDEQSGEWTVAPAEAGAAHEVPVSQTVQDVIAERVDRLPGELRDVLITIAVSGGGCRPEVLSHIHGISRLHAAAVGDALVDRHLVAEEGGAYRCVHPVIAHMVRDGLTASRRTEVHRSLALALELVLGKEKSPTMAGELARHADRGRRARAGLPVRAARGRGRRRRGTRTPRRFPGWIWPPRRPGAPSRRRRWTSSRPTCSRARAGASRRACPPPLPVTREIVSEDLDLRVRG